MRTRESRYREREVQQGKVTRIDDVTVWAKIDRVVGSLPNELVY